MKDDAFIFRNHRNGVLTTVIFPSEIKDKIERNIHNIDYIRDDILALLKKKFSHDISDSYNKSFNILYTMQEIYPYGISFFINFPKDNPCTDEQYNMIKRIVKFALDMD